MTYSHRLPPSPISSRNLSNILPLNKALLIRIPAHAPIHIRIIRTVHLPEKLLVVRDNQQLEIRLLPTDLNNLAETLRQTLDVRRGR